MREGSPARPARRCMDHGELIVVVATFLEFTHFAFHFMALHAVVAAENRVVYFGRFRIMRVEVCHQPVRCVAACRHQGTIAATGRVSLLQ